MNAEKLPKKIYDKCVENKIKSFTLEFSGGSDEGNLYVWAEDENGKQVIGSMAEGLLDDIDSWAWEAYEYSGAGDGSSYGDNITYNIKDKTITSQNWHMVEKFDEPVQDFLEIDYGNFDE